MLTIFENMSEFADTVKAAKGYRVSGSPNWDTSKAEAIKLCKEGNEALATKAVAMLDKIEASLPPVRVRETVKSLNIGRADIGDILVGSPTPMRRKVKRAVVTAPIKIVASVTCSWELTHEQIYERGMAILALAMRVSMTRPMDLYLLMELGSDTHSDGIYYMIRVETQPLAVGQAAFGLGHAAMLRQLGFSLADSEDFNGRWPGGYDSGKYAKLRRERLGLAPQDVVIGEAHSSDLLINDPLAWIENQLARIAEFEQ